MRNARRIACRLAIVPLAAVVTVWPCGLVAVQFRTGVELVTVDFTALDRSNQHIDSLRRDEVTLLVDGRPRQIATLEFRKISTGEKTDNPVTGATKGHETSPSVSARTVLLVVDHESIITGNERLTKDAARAFVRALPASDRVALITMPRGRIEVELTTDHERVARGLDSVVGHASPTRNACDDMREGVLLLEGLEELLEGTETLDGPKTVILISQGLPFGMNRCGDTRSRMKGVAAMAERVRATFYIIQPHAAEGGAQSRGSAGPIRSVGDPLADSMLEGLENLAGSTGGELYRPGARVDMVFDLIGRETSASYVLAFEPLKAERDGKRHRIELTVNRPLVRVRARPSFQLPKASP